MSAKKPLPESTNSTNWWIAGAALILGYYLGNAEQPAQSTTTVAEATPPAITTIEDDSTDYTSAAATLEALADAESVEEVVGDFGDEGDYEAAYVEQAEQYSPSNASTPGSSNYGDETIDAPNAASVAAVAGAKSVASTNRGWSSEPSTATSTTIEPITSYTSPSYQSSTGRASSYRPRPTYVPPPTSYAAPKCESLNCYGVISTTTGRPRTQYVSGYFRKDGTYVRPYYRSKRN